MDSTECSSKRSGKKCTRTYIRKEREEKGHLVVVCGVTRGSERKEGTEKENDLNRCEETIAAYKKANKKIKTEVAKAFIAAGLWMTLNHYIYKYIYIYC